MQKLHQIADEGVSPERKVDFRKGKTGKIGLFRGKDSAGLRIAGQTDPVYTVRVVQMQGKAVFVCFFYPVAGPKGRRCSFLKKAAPGKPSAAS